MHHTVLIVLDFILVLEVGSDAHYRVEAWRYVIQHIGLGVPLTRPRQILDLVDLVLIHLEEADVELNELPGCVAVQHQDEVLRRQYTLLANGPHHLV